MSAPSGSPLQEVLTTFESGILRVVLNREQRLNALTFPLIEQLTTELLRAGRDPEVRVVAIQGAGDRAFCSGDDLTDMQASRRSPVADNVRTHHNVMVRTIRNLPKPVVALLKGFCLGAGFDLALACDIRLAAGNLQMGDQRPLRAIATLSGASWFLPRIVGVGRATELLMTGRRCDAAEAEHIGMVNAVYPLEEFDQRAGEYLAMLADMPTFCLATNKANIEFGLHHPLETSLSAEADRFSVNTRTEDAAEGMRSFQERREPRYTGRPPP